MSFLSKIWREVRRFNPLSSKNSGINRLIGAAGLLYGSTLEYNKYNTGSTWGDAFDKTNSMIKSYLPFGSSSKDSTLKSIMSESPEKIKALAEFKKANAAETANLLNKAGLGLQAVGLYSDYKAQKDQLEWEKEQIRKAEEQKKKEERELKKFNDSMDSAFNTSGLVYL